jgi:hypothetical protein
MERRTRPHWLNLKQHDQSLVAVGGESSGRNDSNVQIFLVFANVVVSQELQLSGISFLFFCLPVVASRGGASRSDPHGNT